GSSGSLFSSSFLISLQRMITLPSLLMKTNPLITFYILF
ncbi:hypothetical protein CP8484711_1963B, partial [Chlamydia psittaci 84-8471/1]